MDDKQEMIKNNMELVNFVIVNKLKYKPYRLEYDDLYQEGYLLLTKAAINYNKDLGIKFSTYATNKIYFGLRGFIDRYYDKRYSFQGFSLENDVSKDSSFELRTWKDLLEDKECKLDEVLFIDIIKRSNINDIEKIINLKINGYSNSEIKEVLKVSIHTIYSRLNRFKREYREVAI